MRALILNSGTGSRMGDMTRSHPKCMTELATGQTILSRQIAQLESSGVADIVITTGPYVEQIEQYASDIAKRARVAFVNNPMYKETNYIYSIYLTREWLDEDILLLHGDLVLADGIIERVLDTPGSVMTVSTTQPLPQKDFKAVLDKGRIIAVGVEFFDLAVAAQPLYKLLRNDWKVWLSEIERFIDEGQMTCYAENALNRTSMNMDLRCLDVKDTLCNEVDTPDDLAFVNRVLKESGE